jgi:hypothetical protein
MTSVDGVEGTTAKETGNGVEVRSKISNPDHLILNNSNCTLQEYNLPRTMVQRLSKGVLPPNTQISKDALLAISKSSTVFVNYLTH